MTKSAGTECELGGGCNQFKGMFTLATPPRLARLGLFEPDRLFLLEAALLLRLRPKISAARVSFFLRARPVRDELVSGGNKKG